MNKFKKQILSAFASGALVLNLVTPVMADTTIVISGNGAQTDNEVELEMETKTTVTQSNTANITNDIDADAKTGDNDAKYNTGGDVTVWTGDAKADVDVSNKLNENYAEVDCCNTGDTTLKIEGNGYDSDNTIDLAGKQEIENKTQIFQDNYAEVLNDVDADAKTGYNDANYNTGGEVVVKTGSAKASVDLSTEANKNSAMVGGGDTHGELSLYISDNGAKTDNEIELELERKLLVVQDNWADVTNDVDADAKTGKNDAEFNTGGETAILTGDAKTDVDVENWLNFNAADLDCGCLLDVLAKVEGNGYESDNDIEAELENKTELFQGGEGAGNYADVLNDVDGDSETGENDAKYSTGDVEGDPLILTGDASSYVDVYNKANTNIYGDFSWEMPEMPDVEFDWDFSWFYFWFHN